MILVRGCQRIEFVENRARLLVVPLLQKRVGQVVKRVQVMQRNLTAGRAFHGGIGRAAIKSNRLGPQSASREDVAGHVQSVRVFGGDIVVTACCLERALGKRGIVVSVNDVVMRSRVCGDLCFDLLGNGSRGFLLR